MGDTDKKILVAEYKRDDGQRIVTRLDTNDGPVNLRDDIENELDGADMQQITVRFFYRGKKWVEALPEAD